MVAELRINGVSHDHATGGRALLAGVAHGGVRDRGGGTVQVGVGQDDGRVLAAHLGLYPAATFGRTASDLAADLGGAGEGDGRDARMVDQRACGCSAAEHDLKHIRREAGAEDGPPAASAVAAAAALDGLRIVALP